VFDENLPDYAYLPEFARCKGNEFKIQRLVQSYVGCVNQRYTDYGPKSLSQCGIRYDSYLPNSEGKCLRDMSHARYALFKELANRIPDARDPGDFIGFVFELWAGEEHYKKYSKATNTLRSGGAGVAFPSWVWIFQAQEELIAKWLSIPDYKPKKFITPAKVELYDIGVIERMVNRWCSAHNKTPRDYWLEAQHLVTLDPRYINAAKSLWECEDAIKEKFGFSIEELRVFLVEAQAKLIEKLDALYEQRFKERTAK
jgi:hypothetical protein